MKSELAKQLDVLTEAMAGPATRRRVKAAAPLGAPAVAAAIAPAAAAIAPEMPRVVAGKGAAAVPAALKAPPPLPPRAKARPEAASANAVASAPRLVSAPTPAVAPTPALAKVDAAPAGARSEVTLLSKNDARREGLAPSKHPRALLSSRPPSFALPRKLTAAALEEAPWASTLGWFTGAENAGEPAPEPFTELTAEALQEEPWGAFLSYLAQPALPASEVLDELVFPDDDGWDLVLNKK